jgi:hemoglobin/transferrin/lactoferrin receptor protein
MSAEEVLPRGVLDRVIVTAGAEKVAIDTPQAVTTLEQEDIDERQATTMADLLEDIPGVSVTGGASALGQSFNIRGIGAALAGDESKLIVQVDGVNKFHEQYRVGSFFSEPELYKRLDVLRGPASSTLYGAGALAGVISFVTKDARDFLSGDDRIATRIKAGYETNAEAMLGSGILAARPFDRVDVLAAYNYRRSSDYINGQDREVLPSESDSQSLLLKTRVHLGDQEGQSLWASYQNWLSDHWQPYDQQVGMVTSLVRREVNDTTAVVGYDNTFAGNDLLDLKMQVSYADTEVRQTGNGFSPTALGMTSEYSYATVQSRIQNTSLLDLARDWRLYLTVGAQNSEQERRNPRTLPNGTVVYGAATHPEGDTRVLGLFLRSEIAWQERLTLIAGIRYDDQRLDPGNGVPTITEANNEAVSPTLAALYNFTPHFGLFGSFARTERLPTLDEVFSRSGARGVSLTLDPEKSDNVELGFTLSFDGVLSESDRVNAKLTGFRNDLTNLITTQSAGSFYAINIGEARYEGLELEAEYVLRSMYVRAEASHMKGTDETTGQPLNTIPADELGLSLGYSVVPRTLMLGWRSEFALRQDEVDALGTATAGYGAHSVFATWKPNNGWLRGAEVRFGVDNVLDKYYRRHLSYLDAEGRTFKLSFGQTF